MRAFAQVADGDEETLARALKGDESAFGAIVRKHQAMVLSLAKRFLRNDFLAEELAQDVFLQLYQHRHTIRSPEHLTFWLRRTTSHRCIDLARHRRFFMEIDIEQAEEIAVKERWPDPFISDLLQKLLLTLTEKQRLVVILRYQEELAPGEIASILEMPLATVKSHLRRSLTILREKLLRKINREGAYE